MSSDEENDELTDLEAIRDKILNQSPSERMQVSAWEDDDDGVEAERNAREPNAQAMLNAAEEGDLEKIDKLLSKDPLLLECTDKDGYTPLHRACYSNHVEVVEFHNLLYLNENNTENLGVFPKLALSAASLAAELALSVNNLSWIRQYLLQLGAKIDAKTLDEWQPLHSACCWNNTECAEILIANGADINAKSKGDQTPLHLASASSHNSPALQLLLLHPDTNPHIVNSSGDRADQIARRTTKYYPLYEIIEPCLNEI